MAPMSLPDICKRNIHICMNKAYVAVPFPAGRLCRNAQMPHICHPERSEGSRIFSHIRRRFLGFTSE